VLSHLEDPTAAKAANVCQRRTARAGGRFVVKKLGRLDKCAASVFKCVQLKPGDQPCLDTAGEKCRAALAAVGVDEATLAATIAKSCDGVQAEDLVADEGLGYGTVNAACTAAFGGAIGDSATLAKCLTHQHECRAEAILALQQPRIGEL